jgi:hypothetical protein
MVDLQRIGIACSNGYDCIKLIVLESLYGDSFLRRITSKAHPLDVGGNIPVGWMAKAIANRLQPGNCFQHPRPSRFSITIWTEGGIERT